MLETVKYMIGAAGPSGYSSKSTADQVTDHSPNLRSITAIITGATSGIGAETARVLAKKGARVVIPARNLKAAEETRARVLSEFPNSEIIVIPLDLSSLKSVRNFVFEFESLGWSLNLLINNAGKFTHEHAISEDGVEMTFATNSLGHFLLTKLLLRKMVVTAKETGIQGRIVNVSSSIHGWFSGDIIRYLGEISRNSCHFDPTRAYALSKLVKPTISVGPKSPSPDYRGIGRNFHETRRRDHFCHVTRVRLNREYSGPTEWMRPARKEDFRYASWRPLIPFALAFSIFVQLYSNIDRNICN